MNKYRDMIMIIGFKPIAHDKNYPYLFPLDGKKPVDMVVPRFKDWHYYKKRTRMYEPMGVHKNEKWPKLA